MYVLITILGVIILLLIFLASIFNAFAKNRNLVKDAWSNIDVALKKRHDLVPNLVAIVKGYAAHESETFERVVAARNAALAVSKGDINGQIKAENNFQQAMKGLFVMVEAYPNLKADGAFITLQNQLSEIEENLERARRYYNSTVRINNTYGESFPGVIFASMFKYQQFDFFEAEENERATVNVDMKN